MHLGRLIVVVVVVVLCWAVVVQAQSLQQQSSRNVTMSQAGSHPSDQQLPAASATSQLAPQRIVGGIPVSTYLYPWVVAIRKIGEQDAWCGGSIVSRYLVLTAAHCFNKKINGAYQTEDIARFEIISGSDDLSSPAAVTHIDYLIRPTGSRTYNPVNKRNDILLIKTRTMLAGGLSNAVQLPVSADDSYVNQVAFAAGFGAVQEQGHSSDKLMSVTLRILPDASCQDYYKRYGDLYYPPGMLCAGELAGGRDSCSGDSGGPLVVRTGSSFTLVGVISFGAGCARANVPNVNTKVSHYLAFIRNNVKRDNALAPPTSRPTGRPVTVPPPLVPTLTPVVPSLPPVVPTSVPLPPAPPAPSTPNLPFPLNLFAGVVTFIGDILPFVEQQSQEQDSAGDNGTAVVELLPTTTRSPSDLLSAAFNVTDRLEGTK